MTRFPILHILANIMLILCIHLHPSLHWNRQNCQNRPIITYNQCVHALLIRALGCKYEPKNVAFYLLLCCKSATSFGAYLQPIRQCALFWIKCHFCNIKKRGNLTFVITSLTCIPGFTTALSTNLGFFANCSFFLQGHLAA